jgi:hypothetical protein
MKSALSILLLLLVSSVLAFTVGEFVIRFIFPEYLLAKTDRSFWHYDAELGWKHLALENGQMVLWDKYGKVISVKITINSVGYRDKERTRSVPLGKYRVAVLGDSFAFGFGVPFESVFATVMERKNEQFEVLNFGVSGYSTDQEVLTLEKVVLAYNPHIVLLIVIGNDFKANNSSTEHGYPKPRYILKGGELVLTNVPVPKILDDWFSLYTIDRSMRRLSALYTFVNYRSPIRDIVVEWYKNRVKAWTERHLPKDGAKGEADAETGTEDPVTLALIKSYINLCDSIKAVPVIVLAPDAYPLGTSLSEEKVRIRDFCTYDHRCRVIDLFPTFNRFQGDASELFLADKHHWTELGHRIVAEELLQELETWIEKGATLTGHR